MKKVHVQDKFQDYSYALTAPIGKQFDAEFTPELTPKQMLELGVFDGWYFDDTHDEFPPEWFEAARIAHSGPDETLNYFAVGASQPLAVWQQKGWIYPDDPRGWFQWYCRYYMGRRIEEEDRRQIKRWKAMRRHIAQVQKACHPGDASCHRKQRQALLHWAYDSRKL